MKCDSLKLDTKCKIFIWLMDFISILADEDVFRQDIGSRMEIGLAERGYKTAQLKCGSDSMTVDLQTYEEFLGVIYTRGSFHDKRPPCFYDTETREGKPLSA
ncbi:hypothetical protein NQ318_019864 [Aromia moschata]|uniref:Uncharacterized protein n=1 Tax=Aromia moschata TaxID=1265417 RepID=A0AAV8YLQ6_9CUCU|nr:hypothetical protein NQ318_019864 [Aromia moschata]